MQKSVQSVRSVRSIESIPQKGDPTMSKRPITIPLHRRVWCKIRFWQSLHNIPDETLARYLDLSVRTLREYDRDAGSLSLERLESFMSATGLTLEQLITF